MSGSSIFGQLPAGTAVLGSVVTLQGTSPWAIAGSVAAIIQGTPNINTAGSVVAFQSLPSSLLTGSSIFGQLPAGIAVLGSVATLQGTSPWNIAGSVVTANITPSSMLTGASIFGQLPGGTAVLGSVAILQGTNPWNISSIYGNISGSVLSQQLGTVISSVVGSIPSSLLTGIYGHRNDAVASYLGADLSWNPITTDSAGRILTKPFTSDNGTLIEYVSSVVSTSVTLIRTSTIGMRNYVTDFLVSNTGSVATRITFQDGSTSILAHTIAPAGGGSNALGINIPFKSATAQDLTFTAGTPVSVLYMTVRGYQAP